MTREELDSQLSQKLSPSIFFKGYYGNIAPEGEPDYYGWNYWFIQGNLGTNVVIPEKVLPKLSLKSADTMVRMVEATFNQDKQLQG